MELTAEQKEKLREGLAGAIGKWMTECAARDEWPVALGYISTDTDKYMADAALAVLLGLSDAQEFAVRDGWIRA